MIFGFRHSALVDLPQWSRHLKTNYWIIRVEGRNATKKRRAYRAIEKERLRLVEAGIHVEHVDAVCKYLVSLKQVNADKLNIILKSEPKQLRLQYLY